MMDSKKTLDLKFMSTVLENSALRLIQDAEGKMQDDVVDLIAEQISEAVKNIDTLLNKPTKKDVSSAFDFRDPVVEVIPRDMVIRISELCEKFRKQALRIEEKHEDLQVAQLAIMNLILEIRKKVAKFWIANEKVDSIKVFENGISRLPGNTQDDVRKIIHFLDPPLPQPRQLKLLVRIIMRDMGIGSFENIGKRMGLQVDLEKFLSRLTLPSSKIDYNIYRKIRNWIVRYVLKFANRRRTAVLNKMCESIQY